MTLKTPPGWGFVGELPAVGAPARKDARRNHHAKAARGASNGNQRLMHMRFALWAASIDAAFDRLPKPGETCDRLDINYETARRLIADWKQLKEETP